MKPAAFEYHRVSTTAEALTTLAQIAPEDGRVLAGGQSLLPAMAFRMARPRHLLDINRIHDLARAVQFDDTLSIGACVRHSAFHRPVIDNPLGRLLSLVVPNIAHYPIRTRGTFCGSIATADPSSEWCCVAATLDARMHVANVRGARTIDASDFFHGLMATDLEPDELLSEVRLPLLHPECRFGFEEFSRRHGDYALGMALAVLRIEDGCIIEPRLGIGAAEPRPRRIPEAEAVLRDRQPTQALIEEAAAAAAAALDPLEDGTTSAAYRRHLVRTLAIRALEQALA